MQRSRSVPLKTSENLCFPVTQTAFTCSKSKMQASEQYVKQQIGVAMETPEKYMKSVQS